MPLSIFLHFLQIQKIPNPATIIRDPAEINTIRDTETGGTEGESVSGAVVIKKEVKASVWSPTEDRDQVSKHTHISSVLWYLHMCDRVCWCPDVWSGCWWDCSAHSCRCFYPDIPPPEVERDWCWDQTHWCWTIHWFLCTRRESHDSHSPLMNTPMNMMMKMMNSLCWWQEQADELENKQKYDQI